MEILQKIIIYTIIFLVVGMVIRETKKHYKKIENETTQNNYLFYHSNKMYSMYFKGIAIFSSIGFALVLLLPSNVEGIGKIIMAIIIYFIIFLVYLFGVWCEKWYIIITNEYIKKYCFWKKDKVKIYQIKDITKVTLSDENVLKIYVNGKKVFTIPKEINSLHLQKFFIENKLLEETKNDYMNFVMYITNVNKYAGIICEICFAFFTTFSIIINYPLGILFFLFCTLCSTIFLMSTFYNCYIIENKTIIHRRLFRVDIRLPFEKIDYVERYYYDNSNNSIFLYSKDKVIMRISANYKHFDLLEKLIKKQHWKWEK